MMRVLFINSRPDSLRNPGGDTIQVEKTKAALENQGVKVDLRAADDLENLPPLDLAHVFNIQEAEPALRAFNQLQEKGIPVLLSPIYWDMYAYWYEYAVSERSGWQKLACGLGKKTTGSLYVGWQRIKAPSKRFWRIQRELLQRARRVLPNSVSEGALLQKSFLLGGGFEAKVDVVPNAIDTDLYHPLPSPSQAFFQQYGLKDFILQVGTINPVKNQFGLIEALFDLPVPLVLIGPAPQAFEQYHQACQRLAEERASRTHLGKVLFLSPLPHDSLPGIYALAAVHALPSWRETPGLVSLEAAAAGCKIVTTSIGSTSDYFGDLAWYCTPNDLPSIRQAVEHALHAPPSGELRQQILTEFTWQRAAEATLKSYQKALSVESKHA